jgi:hypothetical protein
MAGIAQNRQFVDIFLRFVARDWTFGAGWLDVRA